MLLNNIFVGQYENYFTHVEMTLGDSHEPDT